MKEMKRAEDWLTETLASTDGEMVCLPKMQKSFKNVRKTSKKGAITALTVILTTII